MKHNGFSNLLSEEPVVHPVAAKRTEAHEVEFSSHANIIALYVGLELLKDSRTQIPIDALGASDPAIPTRIDFVHAQSLDRAVLLLDRNNFDVVLVDMDLPGAPGLEGFNTFREQASNLPIILIGTADDELIGEKGITLGAQDFLVKGQVTQGLLSRSIRHATERMRAERSLRQTERRLRRQNKVLVRLANSTSLNRGNLAAALREITEATATTLDTEFVDIWLYSGDRRKLLCVDCFDGTSNRHMKGMELDVEDFPIFLRELEEQRTIAAPDVYQDRAVREFVDAYFHQRSISSVLDAPIRVDGEIVGFIRSADTRGVRDWSTEEQNFLGSIADFATLAVEAYELMRAEKTVWDSEEHLSAVIAGAPIILFALDGDGRFILSEGKGLSLLGIEPGMGVGRTVYDAYEKYPAVIQAVRRAMAGESFSETLKVKGTTFEVRFFPRYGDGEATGGVFGIAIDVSEQKRAEEALRYRVEFENLITTLSTHFINLSIDEIDQGIEQALERIGSFAGVDHSYIFLFSEDGNTTSMGHEWAREGLGAQRDYYQGLSFQRFPWWIGKLTRHEVIHVPDVSALPAEAKAERIYLAARGAKSCISIPMIVNGELMGFLGFATARRTKRWTDDSIALLRIVGEMFANAIQRKHQDQERAHFETQLQHGQKLESLGLLAGGIAHDFNNLLVGILGNAGLALLDLAPNSPGRSRVDQIEKAAERAADLTNQLLAYSGKGKFAVTQISLPQLVEEMVNLLETVISQKGSLSIDCQQDSAVIEGDATQIRQVIMNLITNAADAIEDCRGHIEIRTGITTVAKTDFRDSYFADNLVEGNYAYVEIVDDGSGMDAETQAKIFDPFYSTKPSGRGLGLAAVLGIVRGHRGAITVESELDEGTSIRVLFPCQEGEIEETTIIEVESETWEADGTILVVDDDDVVQEVIQSMLERIGFSVLIASTGIEAIDVFRAHEDEIDAVVLDMMMPDMNGEEVFYQLRDIDPDVKVVLSSGYTEHEAIGRFAEDGLAGFIQKPYGPKALMEKLQPVLGSIQERSQ